MASASRLPWRRIVVPGLFTAAMFALAMSLGVWQLHRLTWKLGILADIARAEAGPALPLTDNPPQFAKVQVTGWLIGNNTATLGAEVRDLPGGPTMGTQLIVPLMREKGDPVLVNRGWVPMERDHPLDQTGTETTVEGYILPAQKPGPFSATDDPVGRHFYTSAPAKIGAALGLPRVAPFILVALGPGQRGHFPDPAHDMPRPPNDHLNYAITWFSLGFVLLVIFVIWSRKALRPDDTPGGETP